MAEVAAIGAAVGAVGGGMDIAQKGLELGIFGLEEAQAFTRQTLQIAFPDFDAEKVFWQSVWTEGIYLLGVVLWRLITMFEWLVFWADIIPEWFEVWMNRIFVEYQPFIMLGIPAFFGFREYRRYKLRVRARALAERMGTIATYRGYEAILEKRREVALRERGKREDILKKMAERREIEARTKPPIEGLESLPTQIAT